MNAMFRSEIEALISLLDDPDSFVSLPVIDKLVELGVPIIRILEDQWGKSADLLKQERIENIISKIQREQSLKDIKDWADCGGEQLLYGAYLIEKLHYPSLRFTEIEEQIYLLKKQVWLELNNRLTAFEKIRVLNHFIFSIHKFSPSDKDVLSPHLYYINHVLKTHLGQPISLAILYIDIAEKLELPVYGVNLPGHHLLCYQDKTYANDPDGIMFYINPASGGHILGKEDVKHFLDKQGINYRPEQLLPANKIELLLVLMKGLYNSFAITQETNKAGILHEIIDKIRIDRINQS